MLDTSIDGLLTRYRRDAIMLHRAWPPGDMPRVNSRVGGVPALPKGLSWPRAKDSGRPMHFLAQIDLAELPPTDLLPHQGMLFFFAAVDEEMVWDGDPQNYARVLFDPAPTRATTITLPPDDLPAILGKYSDLTRDWVLPGEPCATIYPRWPLLAHAISSWPDGYGLPDYRSVDVPSYHDAVTQRRADEAIRVAGEPPPPGEQPSWMVRPPERTGALPAGWAHDLGPYVWLLIERIARNLARRADDIRERQDRLPPERPRTFEPALVEILFGDARAWVERARKAGLASPVADADRIAFIAWIEALVASPQSHVNALANEALARGVANAVRYAASSRAVAELLPDAVIDHHAGTHHAVERKSHRAGGKSYARHHQMLGRAPSSQESFDVANPKVMLLQLTSDYGVDFMFCDLGEIEFWIDPEDLIARRFDKIEAYTCGG